MGRLVSTTPRRILTGVRDVRPDPRLIFGGEKGHASLDVFAFNLGPRGLNGLVVQQGFRGNAAGAALFLRSYDQLRHADFGYRTPDPRLFAFVGDALFESVALDLLLLNNVWGACYIDHVTPLA